MKTITINDLSRLNKQSKIIANKNGIVKLENNSSYLLEDYFSFTNKLIMPNYNNSILAIDSSISKYYGFDSKYNSFVELDDVLSSN